MSNTTLPTLEAMDAAGVYVHALDLTCDACDGTTVGRRSALFTADVGDCNRCDGTGSLVTRCVKCKASIGDDCDAAYEDCTRGFEVVVPSAHARHHTCSEACALAVFGRVVVESEALITQLHRSIAIAPKAKALGISVAEYERQERAEHALMDSVAGDRAEAAQ